MKRILIFLIVVAYAEIYNIYSQDLRTSRNTSYYTYIYKLTNEQVKKIYKKGIDNKIEAIYNCQIDSFCTDSVYSKKLPAGHYLYAHTLRNRLVLEVKSVNNADVKILNNNQDLSIMVYNQSGDIISDAFVLLKGNEIKYNKVTKTYLLQKTDKKGFLEITYNGHTSYFNITESLRYSKLKLTKNKILYKSPVKFVAIPATLIINIPVDTYKSIRHQRFSGIYYYLLKPFWDTGKSIVLWEPYGYLSKLQNLFDPYNRRHNGYLVFNKPKYLPGDTAYFKAYLLGKRNRPINKTLDISIYTDKYTSLGSIKPYKPGAYKFQFVVTKDLGFKLDRNYYINLQNNGNTYMSGSFKYEEYELKNTKYELRTDKTNYHFENNVTFYCQGKDENDLNIPDARIELTLLKKEIKEYYEDRVFVKDTLWVHKQNLDPLGETKIIVPDSIFPAAYLSVEAKANFLNSNNELQTRTVTFTKDNIRKEIVFDVDKDSIVILFKRDGNKTTSSANLTIPDFSENTKIKLPFRDKVNPFAKSYEVKVDSINKNQIISEISPEVQCFSNRSKDSVWFSIDNPRNVPLTFTLFKKNKPIFRGNGTNRSFVCKNTTKENYFASVQYIWGGEITTENYTIPFREKQLRVNVYQPAVVFPGQKTSISLSVTDASGNPVSNADITALSVTKKFETIHVPNLEYLGKHYPERSMFNSFNLNNTYNKLNSSQLLKWKRWNPLMALDTIELYKFLYPKDGYYQYVFQRTDTSFAEISAFLVDSIGNPMPVTILYIDHDPVYYSITTNQKPYAFRVTKGWHTITIRTKGKEVELEKIFLKNGTKTIICINPFIKNNKYKVKKMPYWYTANEESLIRNSTFAMRDNYSGSLIYLNQGTNYEIVNPNLNYYEKKIIGPYKQTHFQYNQADFFSINTSFEPGFEYEFLPSHVKMRCWNLFYTGKQYPNYKTPPENFNDSVYTFSDIQEIWENIVKTRQAIQPVYRNPNYTGNGYGLLITDYRYNIEKANEKPKNILIFSCNNPDFLRIYPGNEKTIHDLKPGYYRIETILFDNEYIVTDSILIKPYGSNYCRYNYKNASSRNINIDSISLLIQNRLFKSTIDQSIISKAFDTDKINELAKKNRKITLTGNHFIKGKIFDGSTNETLPGVCIYLKGTKEGTVTDINGNFSLQVPAGNNTIIISFIGFKTEELTLKTGADIRLPLVPDIQNLEEIVVIGYGMQKKAYCTAAISKVHTTSLYDALQGRVAGLDVSVGTSPGILIRGVSSKFTDEKVLYVIDGILATEAPTNINADDIVGMEVIKDASTAVAIYGTRAANGAVIITTKKKSGNALLKDLLQNKTFMEGVTQSKSLRNRFSDYAFWKPDLITDSKGIASFEVTFPDDITSWKTYYLAMGSKGASGQAEAEIKSFKPIMSSLALPRFLIEGDRSNILGKALNYTQDSIQISSSFELSDSVYYKKEGKILTSRIDTLQLEATLSDSLKIKYQIQKDNGYTDGELRYIPVFPRGTIETKGNFYNLENTDTFALPFDKSLGKLTLHADADIIEVLLEEIKHIRNYQHLCNEQLSSKLKSLLWERRIIKTQKKDYKYDKDIRKIINMLENRRNKDSLWGWWQNGATCWWISLHASEALLMAKNEGFKVNVIFELIPPYLYSVYFKMHSRDQLRAVKLLKAVNPVPKYKSLIDSIKISKYDTVGRYELWEVKQICGLPIPKDSLLKEKKTTLFGNIYWGRECYSLFDDAVTTTLVAYRILRKDSLQKELLHKVRNYFLERKGDMKWRNTWETSRILETILPDLINNHELNLKPELYFSGGYTDTIRTFPFHKELKPNDPIYVTKKSNAPVYFTSYQQFFNHQPAAVNKDFVIKSYFEGMDSVLKAGKPVKLYVEVTAKKASEYVMIEIPIPAGCSYQDKNNFWRGEDYREYFKEKVSIYCSRLAQRTYLFEINLLPRYNGVYNLNPAKAELMYFPVFFGREKIKTTKII